MIFFISDLHKSIISDSFLGTNISNEKKAFIKSSYANDKKLEQV
jgi:hypothetical protein